MCRNSPYSAFASKSIDIYRKQPKKVYRRRKLPERGPMISAILAVMACRRGKTTVPDPLTIQANRGEADLRRVMGDVLGKPRNRRQTPISGQDSVESTKNRVSFIGNLPDGSG
jgi:hypothetical protein